MRKYLCLATAAFLCVWLALSRGKDPDNAKEVTNSIGMKLRRIDPGEFIMGQGQAPARTKEEFLTRDWDEAPAHPVKISRAFYMGATEVTHAQYEQFDPDHKKQRGK